MKLFKKSEINNTTKIYHLADEVGSTPIDYVVDFHDKYLKNEIISFLKSCNVDILNSNFFDCYIENEVHRALNDLKQQQLKHHRTIIGLDEEKLVKIAQYQKEISMIQSQINANDKEIQSYEESQKL